MFPTVKRCTKNIKKKPIGLEVSVIMEALHDVTLIVCPTYNYEIIRKVCFCTTCKMFEHYRKILCFSSRYTSSGDLCLNKQGLTSTQTSLIRLA